MWDIKLTLGQDEEMEHVGFTVLWLQENEFYLIPQCWIGHQA